MATKGMFVVVILLVGGVSLGFSIGQRWQGRGAPLADGVLVGEWGVSGDQHSIEWKTSIVLDNSILNGGYASADAGGATSSNFALTEVFGSLGVWVFDGRGRFTRARTARATVNGLDSPTFTGTYTVLSDGRATFRLDGGSVFDGIVVANGDGFFYSNLSTIRTAQSGYARRIVEQPR